MKDCELLLSAFLDATESIKSKHPKYGTRTIRHRRGRGRGCTLPYLLKCIKKSRNTTLSGCYFDEDKGFYRFWSYHCKPLRKAASKHVRKYSGNIGDHAFYRKISDYQWNCF